MHPFVAFLIALLLISILGIRYRIPPFILLLGVALGYGALAEVPADRILSVLTSGAGGVFAMLGIIIYAGAVIAAVLEQSGYLVLMVRDMQRISPNPRFTSLLTGYLFAIPLMCCFTSYVVLHPLISCLQQQGRKTLLYLTAIGSVISFILIYPSPVMVGMIQILSSSTSPYSIDFFTIPISLVLVALIYAIVRIEKDTISAPLDETCRQGKPLHRLRIWGSFLVIVVFILVGLLFPPLHILANVNLALFIGMIVALLSAPADIRLPAVSSATKRAGTIIFDLCGAGAFGAVIGASAFSTQIFGTISPFIPLSIIPFAIAVLIQTAQGSRTVTAIVTAQILAASGMVSSFHPIGLLLMIAAGTLIISYMSDPYFWLIQRTTGDEPKEVVKKFTIPLVVLGISLFFIALLMPMLM